MSQAQFYQTVQQQEREELEYEIRERKRMDALDIKAEMDPDKEFRDALGEKFPQLKAWPGRTTK